MSASVPEVLAAWMRPFASCFTAAVWRHALVLVAGTLLTPGRRTVTAALRVMGLDQAAGFAVHHRVLSTACWSSRLVARRLLLMLVAALAPDSPVVVGFDDTIERRWGAEIKARGSYRDPVRSRHGHFVKAFGLRWLRLTLLAPVPWAGCLWALPFLTMLAPSERYAAKQGRRHKKLTDWARQALLQTARWLPGRRIVAVADSSLSAIKLLRDAGRHLCLVSRLRLDAGLYAPAPPRRPGTPGRPPVKGERLPSLKQRLANPATCWRNATLDGGYGGPERRLAIASGTALWRHPGMQVPIRWVLVRDPSGEKPPQGYVCPDLHAEPLHLLVDSTGMRLYGAGEWLLEKHGIKARRSWRKLHIGLDAGSGQIVSASLTSKEVDDGAEVGPLLDQITGAVALFTGDGGYDQDRVYAGVAEHRPEAAVVVPPRATAVPSDTAETAPTQRDRHLQHIAEHGRMAWQKASGYTTRARAEAAIGRFKQVIGDGLRSRADDRRTTKVDVAVHALNRMVDLGRPNYVRIV